MKILIATDGSDFSRRAIEKCCQFISANNISEIKIISVAEWLVPMAAEPFAVSSEYYAQVQEGLNKKAEQSVMEAEKMIKDLLADKVPVTVEFFTGNVKEILIEEAKKNKIDLIVVGSHGYGFLDRVLLGSISNFVVQHAPCSVLVVKE